MTQPVHLESLLEQEVTFVPWPGAAPVKGVLRLQSRNHATYRVVGKERTIGFHCADVRVEAETIFRTI